MPEAMEKGMRLGGRGGAVAPVKSYCGGD